MKGEIDMETDVLVIGGGVIGSAIARELSRYKLKTFLLDKNEDIAMGTSKANSGIIHAGYNAKPGSIKGDLNIEANPKFDILCKELNVPFNRIGSLVVGLKRDDLIKLKQLKFQGENKGIKGLDILQGEKLFELEPNLNPKAKWALYAPTAGIISPYEFGLALAENAVVNGVTVLLNTEVLNIYTNNRRIVAVKTNRGIIKTPVIVNAAGLYADKIMSMAGGEIHEIIPYKGEYLLFDKKVSNIVNHIIFPIPEENTKGVLVTPTVHGNLLIGPNSTRIKNKNDLSTTERGLNEVYNKAKRLIPSLSRSNVITSFSGTRAKSVGNDFIIGLDSRIKGLINVAGIQSPGLSAAPAIAERVIELIKEISLLWIGKGIRKKENFQSELPELNRFVVNNNIKNYTGWQKLIDKNPDYGEIICRCEHVTRGEIIDAIHRPIPANSLDTIKRRTRAGGGRCQGGFCAPKIVNILARELGVSSIQVTKKGKGSEILYSETKELILKK